MTDTTSRWSDFDAALDLIDPVLLKVLWAFMLAGVHDVHSAQDNLKEDEWTIGEQAFEAISARIEESTMNSDKTTRDRAFKIIDTKRGTISEFLPASPDSKDTTPGWADRLAATAALRHRISFLRNHMDFGRDDIAAAAAFERDEVAPLVRVADWLEAINNEL